MLQKESTDIEIADFILSLFYNDGDYQHISLSYIDEQIKERANFKVHSFDLKRIIINLTKQRIIRLTNAGEDLVYLIDDNGMIIMRQHGSYSNYVSSKEQKETKKEGIERNDRRVKNVGILATIIISLLTLFLTQCPKPIDQQQKKTEEGILSIQKALDSLKNVLKQSTVLPKSKTVIDTATSR